MRAAWSPASIAAAGRHRQLLPAAAGQRRMAALRSRPRHLQGPQRVRRVSGAAGAAGVATGDRRPVCARRCAAPCSTRCFSPASCCRSRAPHGACWRRPPCSSCCLTFITTEQPRLRLRIVMLAVGGGACDRAADRGAAFARRGGRPVQAAHLARPELRRRRDRPVRPAPARRPARARCAARHRPAAVRPLFPGRPAQLLSQRLHERRLACRARAI